MQESVNRYADGVRRTEGVPIQIRVGLNSGEVVVGSIGNDLKMDYTAIGQTVHLASRMEQMATPGSVLMTPDALRLAEGYVQVKPLGPVSVKGLTEPLEVYEVTGVGAARSRLQAAAGRGLTRFVGRTAEFETLCQALDGARNGHGQIVALVGEPGVGKSRLVWEFIHSRRTVDWLILHSGSVSYGKATPYLPLIDLLKAYFKIHNGDNSREIREKVTGKLLTLDEALKSTLPALLTLLDVGADDENWQALEPTEQHRRTLDAVKRVLLRESQVQPLLAVFEDLHWIDSETQAFLDSLIDSLPTARMLLLVNYRPEYQHNWGSKTYYSQIRIDPLPPESAMEVLGALLGDNRALKPLKDLLIARTEGTPFFLEESVRTLVETNILTGARGNYELAKPIGSIRIPVSVHAVLAARIDRLSIEAKQLLQSASVIGKDFSFTLLSAIAELSEEELRVELGHLQGAEFLYETRFFPEVEYTFKHALTHEVAYASLLQEHRRKLHAQIVDAIEKLCSDRINEHVERLAQHAVRAQLWGKAIEYLHQAGKKAATRSATQESIGYFEQALEAVNHVSRERRTIEKTVDIRIDLGPGLMARSGFSAPEVEQNYMQARELCEKLGDAARLFPVLWGLALVHNVRGEPKKGRELGDELLKLAQRLDDPALILEAHHMQWTTSFNLGDWVAAKNHIESGRLLYNPQQHSRYAFQYGGHDPGVCCDVHAALVLWHLGYPDQALQRSGEAISRAETLSQPFSLAQSWFWTAYLHQLRGERKAVERLTEMGMALATERKFARFMNLGIALRGWLAVKHGDVEEGIDQLRQALATQTFNQEQQQSVAFLAEGYAKAGRIDQGLRVLEDAFVVASKTGMHTYEPELHRVKGHLLLTWGGADRREAEVCFQNAVKIARSQNAKSLELRAATSLAQLWQRQGKLNQARNLLGEIYGWFTEGFDTADLKEAKGLLQQLS
jgi:predicted ATPase